VATAGTRGSPAAAAGASPLAAAAATAAEAPEAAPAVVTPLYTGKTAVVVGAGPAGATAAMFLARQGFKVDVSCVVCVGDVVPVHTASKP
jgi:heterodisulfide reductase subunit A-like polyferredoxin